MYLKISDYTADMIEMADTEGSDYIENIIEMASAKVDELTFNRIQTIGFDNLTTFQKEKVKSAVLAQAQYYSKYGMDMESIQSFSVLDISISTGGQKYPGVSPACIIQLKQTGLMDRRNAF